MFLSCDVVIESPFNLRLEALAQDFPLYRNALNLSSKAVILKSFLHKVSDRAFVCKVNTSWRR